MTKKKKGLLLALGILVSAGFLWFALRGTSFTEIGDSLAAANLWLIAPMLAAYGAHYWIKAVRWRMLLRPIRDASSGSLFRPMMIGFFGNNVLPAHLGEFVRMFLGARQLGLRNSEVLATIVLERMFDFLSIVAFLGATLVVGTDVPENLVTVGYVTAIVAVAFILVAAAYITWTPTFLAVVRRTTFFVPHKLRDRLVHQLEVGAMGLQAIRRPSLLLGIVVTSILQWALMGIAIYVSLRAVGIDAQISPAFVVLAATTFGVALPSAPGFLGTIQAAYVVALLPYGVSKSDAFAASAFFHVPTYVVVTLLGLWLLKGAGYKVAQIQAEAESAADE